MTVPMAKDSRGAGPVDNMQSLQSSNDSDDSSTAHNIEKPPVADQRDSHQSDIEKGAVEKDEEAAKSDDAEEEEVKNYPQGFRLMLVVLGLAMAVFLVFLDMTVISTAIPAITNRFRSLEDVGWYGSAFMLTVWHESCE
jgi:hypothetical protein